MEKEIMGIQVHRTPEFDGKCIKERIVLTCQEIPHGEIHHLFLKKHTAFTLLMKLSETLLKGLDKE